MKVLVADDDTSCRLVLKAAVERLGHTCLLACDGTEAWELFQAELPDVLITDWMMPGLDGPELCRRVRLRNDDGYSYLILATSLGEHEYVLEGMEAGADDYLTKPISPFDVRARLIAATRVTSLHKELERLNTELAEQARTDPLTRVGNRLRLHEDLAAYHDRAERYGHAYCVAIMDIDHFKEYNDTYGHLAGDATLVEIGRTLDHGRRTGDGAYRYGGEEFVIVYANQALPDATLATERLRHAVEELAIPHTRNTPTSIMTISAGVAAWQFGDTPDDTIARADEALYTSKASGRNQTTAAPTHVSDPAPSS